MKPRLRPDRRRQKPADAVDCVVPHCHRWCHKRRRDRLVSEFMCGQHWVLTDKRLRRLFRKARKLELWRVENRVWKWLRSQAIERGAGFR